MIFFYNKRIKSNLFLSMLFVLFTMLSLAGCSSKINYDITDSSVALNGLKDNIYINPDDSDDTYLYIEIDGVVYVPFGVQNATITGDMIGECIAYDADDSNSRYYKLIDNSDFIASYHVSGVMEQFTFFRRIDSKDKDIDIPDYIYDQEYLIWN